MTDLAVLPLGPEQLTGAWPLIDEYARAFAERFPDDWPLNEQMRRAVGGETLLWLIWSEDERAAYGFIGTEVRVCASGKRVMKVVSAGGRDHEKWVPLADDVLSEHARRNDCTEFHVDGRVGWQRSLPHWKATRWVNLVKELTHG